MVRGYLRWRTPTTANVATHLPDMLRTAAVQHGVVDSAFLLGAIGTSLEPLPESDQPLEPRDQAIYLLHIAAEVEHALLVEYLYAAFSLGQRNARSTGPYALNSSQLDLVFGDAAGTHEGWQQTILEIAKEEMGHLLMVQNLLYLIGGPLTFEREDFPFQSEFYPFPFGLRPFSKDTLAKYVAAERPEQPDPITYPRIAEIDCRAAQANADKPVNQVGKLYRKLIAVFTGLPLELLYPDTEDTYQAKPAMGEPRWGSGQAPRNIMDSTFGGDPAQARASAIAGLNAIAQQGEGPTGSGMDGSHFSRFYAIYDQCPETNATFGNLSWQPALPVPSNPNTNPAPWDDAKMDAGRITDPLARDWAHLFNLRYRMLLCDLSHYFQLNAARYPKSRIALHQWAINEMRSLRTVSNLLTSLPRKVCNPYENGAPAVAGAPFELPFTLSLPTTQKARWAVHGSLLQESTNLINKILKADTSPVAKAALASLAHSDAIETAALPGLIAETNDGTPQKPKPGPMTQAALNSFDDVRKLFNDFIAASGIDLGLAPHGDFWNSMHYADFISKSVPFISDDVPILVPGDPLKSNLVTILRGPLTLPSGNTIAQMPEGGPVMPKEMVDVLADWIKNKCPNPTAGQT